MQADKICFSPVTASESGHMDYIRDIVLWHRDKRQSYPQTSDISDDTAAGDGATSALFRHSDQGRLARLGTVNHVTVGTLQLQMSRVSTCH